jgi:hypothetical protein
LLAGKTRKITSVEEMNEAMIETGAAARRR